MSPSRQPWLHELVTAVSAPTAALSGHGGQIRPDGAQGVMHADARVLSAAVLAVGGTEPVPLSSGLLSAGTALFIGACRGLGDDGPDPTVRVERERSVTPGRVRERIRLISASAAGVRAEVTLRVAADLASIGEIKAGRRRAPVPVRAQAPAQVPADAPARFPAEVPAGAGGAGDGGAPPAVLGWGAGALRVRLTAPGARATVSGPADAGGADAGGADAGGADSGGAEADSAAVLRWRAELAGRGEAEFSWELTVTDPEAVVVPYAGLAGHQAADGPGNGAAARRGAVLSWAGVRARGTDPRLPQLLDQAMADVGALVLATARAPGDGFLAGGAPWYLTLFGRDSIWAARLMLPFGWQLAAGTLRALAGLQGTRVDPATGEAPGKIPHELRTASRRAAGGLPALYYGTIDATPLWICLLHDAWRWGMPASQVRALLPSLTAALGYLREHGDADGDGFLEYLDESGHGLANQGWKDSGDAIRFADGAVARPPVALCEVQAYAFEAASRGADLLDAFGQPGAGPCRRWAADLAAAFRSVFWVAGDDGRYPALALDGRKRRVDSVTSNIGHLLGTGLLTPAEEDEVAARLVGPGMSSGFGLRTMSAANAGYSPLSYHCGSVWSHDTAIVIRGLAAGGHAAEAAVLADSLLDAAAAFGWRLPELFAGDARSAVPWPSPYPASCRPQAWAAAAAGALVQALLGLEVDVPAGRVRVTPPASRAAVLGAGLHVDGLVAGHETFSAGITESGDGYTRGLSALAAAP